MTRGFPEKGGRHGDDGLKIGREGMEPSPSSSTWRSDQKKPFFLWYAPFLPHSPHNPPERLLKKYRAADRPRSIAKYDAMCEWFDETCGQLMAIWTRRSPRQHADRVRVRQRLDPEPRQQRIRTTFEADAVRRWHSHADHVFMAGKIAARGPNANCAAALICCRRFSPPPGGSPDDLPGLNLLPNLKTGDPIERDTIFGEQFAHDIADIEKPEASLLFRWCIAGQMETAADVRRRSQSLSVTHPRTEKGPQLFDLSADPEETKNLAGENPEIVADGQKN